MSLAKWSSELCSAVIISVLLDQGCCPFRDVLVQISFIAVSLFPKQSKSILAVIQQNVPSCERGVHFSELFAAPSISSTISGSDQISILYHDVAFRK